MGIGSSKDLFSSRWINAEISDASSRLWIVHVKHLLGEYFLADIEGRLYAFRLEGSRIHTIKHTATKSYRIIHYDTTHYMPISPDNLKLMENIVTEHSLPKIDRRMYDVFSLLSKREKNLKPGEKFEGHNIEELVADIVKEKNHNPEKAENLRIFLSELNTKQILTPVRKLHEFLDYDIKLADPKFLGDISTQHMRTEIENKIMTNRPNKGKTSVLKLVIVIMFAGIVIGAGIYILQSGMISNLVPTIGGGTSGHVGIADLQNRYPTPESMIDAIHKNELDCHQLTPDIKLMVNNKTPHTCP